MKPRLVSLGLLSLLLLLLAACSLGDDTTGPDSGNSDATSSLPPNSALPYSEIRVKFEDLHDRLVNAQDQLAIEATQKELDKNWRELTGKGLVGWSGWVVSAGAAVSESVKSWGEQTVDSVGATSLLLALDDPYAAYTASETPTQTEQVALGVVTLQPMAVLIQREGAMAEQPFSIGQRVVFTGTVRSLADHYTRQGLVVSSADMTPVDNGTPRTPVADDLRDVVISLERTSCFGACPDYRVTAYGDGAVVFEGRRYTKDSGFRIAHVGEDKIRQLISEFDKADFYSLKDYTDYNISDSPSVITSITQPGKSKMVNHYFGDDSAPEKLTQLEEKIDKILDTEQWVK